MTSSEKDVVSINDAGQEVSFKLYQDVYNSVTGKSEKLTRMYYDNYHAVLSDFEQLHAIIAQTIEQYDCRQSTLTVVAKYSDGRTERFSGIERFKLQGVNKQACVEHIDFQYDFLFVLPGTKQPKKYRLEVWLLSGVGIEDRLDRTKANETERFMNATVTQFSSRVDIEYIDLSVARNLEAQVDEWFRGLPENQYGWLSKLTHSVRSGLELSVKILSFFALSVAAMHFLFPQVADSQTLFQSIIVFVTSAFLVSYVSSAVIPFFRKRFERIGPRSMVELAKCDREKKSAIDGTFTSAWLAFIAMTTVSVLSGLLTTLIGKHLGF